MPSAMTKLLETAYQAVGRIAPCDVAYAYQLDTSQAQAPSGGAPQSAEYRFLSSDEVSRFAADAANQMSTDGQRWLDDGSVSCFAVLLDGRLAAYAWFAAGRVEAEHNRGSSRLDGLSSVDFLIVDGQSVGTLHQERGTEKC